MTRDKAIEEIKNYENYPNGLSEECRNYIIKALEQKPTSKNDLGVDCISRAEVIEEINSIANDAWDEEQMRVDLIAEINALPSVTPIRPKGHWIWEVDATPSTPISPYELNYAGWVCSCCHEFPDDICEWDDPDEPPTYKFCPNCGAEIESEDKE